MATLIQSSNKSPKNRVGYDCKFFANKVTYRKVDFYEGDKVEVKLSDRQTVVGILAQFIPNSHYSKRQLGTVSVALPMCPGSEIYIFKNVKMSQLKLVAEPTPTTQAQEA